MRPAAIVLGVLLLLGGGLVGCSALLVTLTFFEPPSPSWNFRPAPGEVRTPPLRAGPYVVWIDQPAGERCALTVLREGGAPVGTDEGERLCRVSGSAGADEVWRVEAVAGPDAIGALASDPPIALPIGLKLVLGGCALAIALGLAGIVSGAWPRPRARGPT
ncbi:MAG: hypothetical protein KF850_13325 [Labilithrix sp.]|nr:hypothetical protein [Labilithrix sp.]MBX3213012.1 hypothetical protein [Labilithrix sp.]